MARGTDKSGGLKSWVYPKGSGIRLREILNSHGGDVYGASYQVVVPSKITGGLRERRQFKTKQEAEEHADNAYNGFKEQGRGYFAMSDEERREVAACIPLLREKGISLRDAVDFALKRLVTGAKGKTLADTVAELVASKQQRFERGDLRERSLRDFRHRAEKFATALEDKPIAEITGQQVKVWLAAQKLGPRTNKNYIAVLGEVFRYAAQKRYVAFSPLDDLSDVERKELYGSGTAEAEPSILTPEQAEKLLNAAQEHSELNMLGAVVLGLFCGIRTEELKRLDWSHVRLDDEHPVVTIGAGIAKKRRIRHVDIPGNARTWLSLLPNRTGPVAGNEHTNHYQKRFKRLQLLAGFKEWEANAMRHSFGSYHYALHGNPLETSRLLGHKASDQVLFDHYRALATKDQATRYFAIVPTPANGKVVKFA